MLQTFQKPMLIASLAALTACAGPTAQRGINGGPPGPAEVKQMVREAYVASRNKEPFDLRINEVKYRDIFFNEQELTSDNFPFAASRSDPILRPAIQLYSKMSEDCCISSFGRRTSQNMK